MVSTPPRRTRWLRWLLVLPAVLLLVLAGLLAAGAWWASRDQATLPWVLAQLPGVTAQGVQGTLRSDRWQVARLQWVAPGQAGTLTLEDLHLQGLGARWQPHPGAWLGLRVDRLQVGRATWRSGPPSGQPLALPASLRLPLTLDVGALAVGHLQVDAQPAVHGLQAALALGAAQGARHQLSGLGFTLDSGSPDQPAPLQVQGQATLAADAPFALAADWQVVNTARAPAWQAQGQLKGPLAELQASARLRGLPAATTATTAPASAAPDPAPPALDVQGHPAPPGRLAAGRAEPAHPGAGPAGPGPGLAAHTGCRARPR